MILYDARKGEFVANTKSWLCSVLVFTCPLALAPPTRAQTFDSGSDGSDGALDYTGQSGTIIFDPAAFNPPLDADGDNVFHFTTITIPAGVTLRLRASELNFAPVYWLATGAVAITGTLDLSGENGHAGGSGVLAPTWAVPGPGGFPGGAGHSWAGASPSFSSGFGPGAGAGGGPGSSCCTCCSCYGVSATFTYGNVFLMPLIGGSGGGGDGADSPNSIGAGGGAGGGAIVIACTASLTISGSIKAVGGNGGLGNGSAGGGSGGSIRLLATTISGTGQLNTNGGDNSYSSCNDGHAGRVRTEAIQYTFNGPISANSRRHVPLTDGTVFLPTLSVPSIYVVSIGGIDVPNRPTGDAFSPDVIMNSSGPVIVELEANNVPLGSTVKVYVYATEGGITQIADSTPLTGTLTLSTATAPISFTSGLSLSNIRAIWVP